MYVFLRRYDGLLSVTLTEDLLDYHSLSDGAVVSHHGSSSANASNARVSQISCLSPENVFKSDVDIHLAVGEAER